MKLLLSRKRGDANPATLNPTPCFKSFERGPGELFLQKSFPRHLPNQILLAYHFDLFNHDRSFRHVLHIPAVVSGFGGGNGIQNVKSVGQLAEAGILGVEVRCVLVHDKELRGRRIRVRGASHGEDAPGMLQVVCHKAVGFEFKRSGLYTLAMKDEQKTYILHGHAEKVIHGKNGYCGIYVPIKRYQNGSFQTVWYLASFFNSNISVVKGDTVFLRGYRISDKSYNGFDYLDLTCSDIIGIHNL